MGILLGADAGFCLAATSGAPRRARVACAVRLARRARDDAKVPTAEPTSSAPTGLADLLDEAVDLVRQAGRMTLDWFGAADLAVERKQDGTPVTEADKAAERFLRDELAGRFPDDAIVGEEHVDRAGTSGRTWIIDPIDGTKAFTHGVPLYCNLLALEDDQGSLLGVINMPALGETVYAARGVGCFVDGRTARVSDRGRLAGSYLTACGYDYWSDELLGAARDAGAVLRTWGDGYGYALVATGRVDAMCDPEVARWDVAPMPVILAEAGGRFTDLDGQPGALGRSGLATNGVLHELWLDRLGARPRLRPAAP
jgi:histidinol phosphatase-like enzyme (inositol monophosphatase family)